VAQNNQFDSLNLEDIRIGEIKVLESLETANDIEYYRYVSKEKIESFFGPADRMVSRNDELMETEIIRLKYGKSYVEFYDHSFGAGIKEDDYSLYSIALMDDRLWLEYEGEIIRVGLESTNFFANTNEKGQSEIVLKRGILDEISDFILKIGFEEQKVNSAIMIFD